MARGMKRKRQPRRRPPDRDDLPMIPLRPAREMADWEWAERGERERRRRELERRAADDPFNLVQADPFKLYGLD